MGNSLHSHRHWFGAFHPRTLSIDRPGRNRPGQYPRGRFDLADDHPHAAENRFFRPTSGAGTLARHWSHAVYQLGGKALFHGCLGLVVHRLFICADVGVIGN